MSEDPREIERRNRERRRAGERRADIRRRTERLEALVELSRTVYASRNVDELLDNILAAATTLTGAARGTVYICDAARRELWSRVTAGSERVEIRLPFGQGLAGTTAESGKSLLVDDVRQHPAFDPETDKRTGFRTENALCVPIRDHGDAVVVVLQLLNKAGGFYDDDIEFLDLMGVHVAQSLANSQAQQAQLEAEKLMKELELAREIQEQLLPTELPRLGRLTLAGRMVTSRQVGGDYYDALRLPDGRTLVVLADVSGKGVAAGLVMSNLQAALRATAGFGLDLADWAAQLNEQLYERLEGARYVTAFFVLIDAEGRVGCYLNAGHPPGLLVGGNDVRRLESTGMPLGMLPAGPPYDVGHVEFGEADWLLLYSDGLTEATGRDGADLEVEGLEAIVKSLPRCGPEETADRLLDAVLRYGAEDKNPDDRTLLLAMPVSD